MIRSTPFGGVVAGALLLLLSACSSSPEPSAGPSQPATAGPQPSAATSGGPSMEPSAPPTYPPSTDATWTFTVGESAGACTGTFEVVNMGSTDDDTLQQVHDYMQRNNPDFEYSAMRFELDWTAMDPGPETRDLSCGAAGVTLWPEDWVAVEPGSIEDMVTYDGPDDPAEIVNLFLGNDDLGAHAGQTGVDYVFFTDGEVPPFVAVTVDPFGEGMGGVFAEQT